MDLVDFYEKIDYYRTFIRKAKTLASAAVADWNEV